MNPRDGWEHLTRREAVELPPEPEPKRFFGFELYVHDYLPDNWLIFGSKSDSNKHPNILIVKNVKP